MNETEKNTGRTGLLQQLEFGVLRELSDLQRGTAGAGNHFSGSMKKKIVIDCDPGIDDALAILLALSSSEIEVIAITVVHGNCSVDQGTKNALSVLELAGRSDIPVYKGCDLPLVQPSLLAPETHGSTGLGYAVLPEPQIQAAAPHAVSFLVDVFMTVQHCLTEGYRAYLFIGYWSTDKHCPSNPSPTKACDCHPSYLCYGGCDQGRRSGSLIPGNTTPVAEFNTYVDPHAAHIVFHSGVKITLTPLDVTYQCIVTEDLIQILTNSHPNSRLIDFIVQSTKFYMEFHDEYQNIKGCVINDPLTLSLLIDPSFCRYEDHYIDVDIGIYHLTIGSGVSLGKTFADFYRMTKKPSNIRVALGVEADAFLEFFQKQMSSLALSLDRKNACK